jgi:hypothetical protein
MQRAKSRRCKAPACHNRFEPAKPYQIWCSVECATAIALIKLEKIKAAKVKAERKIDRERKIEIKPLQYWLKRAEKAVNEFCRERDLRAGFGCITCGTNDAEMWHAGHWISVGASSGTRYDPANINLQCRQCNVFGGGRAQEYEARLPARIGQQEVDRLKYAKRERKWTREECQSIESEFKEKLKELKS